MSHPPVVQSAIAAAQLGSCPINPSWIIDGAPMARVALLSRSADGRVWTDLWECTAGSFHWYYDINEAIHVLDGAAIVTDCNGAIWHLKPGDVIQFRVGTKARWHIPHYVRKVAFCSDPVPGLLALLLRARGLMRKVADRVLRRIRTEHITALSLMVIPL